MFEGAPLLAIHTAKRIDGKETEQLLYVQQTHKPCTKTRTMYWVTRHVMLCN